VVGVVRIRWWRLRRNCMIGLRPSRGAPHVSCSSDSRLNSPDPTQSDSCGLCSVGSRSGVGTRHMNSCSGPRQPRFNLRRSN
jgi:hypothetical protein